MTMKNDAMKLPIESIEPNPNQPRQVFSQKKLEGLAQSIRQVGIIQPIVVELFEVQGDGCRYLIHDGERRWRAAKMAGLETVPCVISVADDGDVASEEERLSRALVANIQREGLNPVETGRGYQNLHDLGWSDNKIAQVAGVSRSSVANTRRLLKLPAEIRDPIAEGQISERQGLALLPVYQLPDMLQKESRGKKGFKYLRDNLIKGASKGVSSATLRADVSFLIIRCTCDLSDYKLVNHPFAGQPKCGDCPNVVKHQKRLRCPDYECLDRKKSGWSDYCLAEASKASGLEPLEKLDDLWKTTETFGANKDQWQDITGNGCPNLRLRYESHFSHSPAVNDFKDIKIVCFHNGRGCKCLADMLREQKKNDPDRQAEKENKKRLENEIVAPATQILMAALVGNDPNAWRLMLQRMFHVYLNDTKGWALEKIQRRIARNLVANWISWNAHQDLDKTRDVVQKRLDQVGLALPDPDILGNITYRISRIFDWVEAISEETPLYQIDDNFHNLNQLVEEIDEIEAIDSHQEQAIRAWLGKIADAIDLLLKARTEREDNQFMKRFR